MEETIKKLLQNLGEDINRQGIIETPKRVAKAMKEMLNGYEQNDISFYKLFDCDNKELVVVKDIDFTSFCEHHLLPFSGIVHIGYIPNDKVIGLSKFGRIVDCFAHRLQLQEKLTKDIANSIINNLKPKSLFVVIEAKHDCMACRGIKKKNSRTRTFFTYGAFKKYKYNDILDLIK